MYRLQYYRNLVEDLIESGYEATAEDINALCDEVERLRNLLETHLNLPPELPRTDDDSDISPAGPM